MQVILKENIENLGKVGDVVKVSDGYARNYLLPLKRVAIANSKNIAKIEHEKRLLEKKRQLVRQASAELLTKLEGVSVVIQKKTHDNNKLFGSVTVHEIAQALEAQGLKVFKSSIMVASPIRALGNFDVTVRLETDMEATITVQVVKESVA